MIVVVLNLNFGDNMLHGHINKHIIFLSFGSILSGIHLGVTYTALSFVKIFNFFSAT